MFIVGKFKKYSIIMIQIQMKKKQYNFNGRKRYYYLKK